MNRSLKRPALWVSAILVILTLLEGANYWFGFRRAADMDSGTSGEKTVLYWYDPMVPDKHFEKSGKSPFMDMQLVPKYAQTTAAAKAEPMYWYDPMIPDKHFDKPGKSPFMDMQLVPKYPDGAGDDGGSIRISPATLQNLGVRTSQVESGTLSAAAHVPGSVAWDQRSAFEINARVDGVVDILGIRAPYETVRKGQALAELIAPEWSAAAQEYLELGRAHGRRLRPSPELRQLGSGHLGVGVRRRVDPVDRAGTHRFGEVPRARRRSRAILAPETSALALHGLIQLKGHRSLCRQRLPAATRNAWARSLPTSSVHKPKRLTARRSSPGRASPP